MIDKAKIEQLVAENIDSDDMFLVGISCTPDNNIGVTVDSDDRMTIDRCISLSKAIEAGLDRDREDFSLTVTSAGVGQPLSHPRQYAKLIGKPVEIILRSGVKIKGTLTGFSGDALQVEYQTLEAVEGKKRKVPMTRTESFALDQIKSTKEEITIK